MAEWVEGITQSVDGKVGVECTRCGSSSTIKFSLNRKTSLHYFLCCPGCGVLMIDAINSNQKSSVEKCRSLIFDPMDEEHLGAIEAIAKRRAGL